VVGSWQSGFQGQVTVTNTGGTGLSGWTVSWTWPDGQALTQAWGGTATSSGGAVSVRNESWNLPAPAASVTFGFLASSNGSNTAPVPVCSAL
jgi:chitin-binding protein